MLFFINSATKSLKYPHLSVLLAMTVEEKLWNNEPFSVVRDRFVSSREYTVYFRNLLGKTWIPDFLAPLGGAVSRIFLKASFGGKNSVEDFQRVAGKGLEFLINHTMDGFDFDISSLEGPLEDSKKENKGIIFLSTHGDAILDAALTSYVLLNDAGTSTPHIAFGDNFLKHSLFADFFALNRGFPVYRDFRGRSALIEEMRRLSGVIDKYTSNGEHVWIANQSHRAKDGNNSTQKSVIGSLYAAHRGTPLHEWLDENILIPVAVSYEFSPNDVMFTLELFKKEFYKKRGEEYSNPKGWDMKTFMNGLLGQKGHVALRFGRRIQGDFDSVMDTVKALDAEFHRNYHLTPPNKVARNMLYGIAAGTEISRAGDYTADDAAKFEKRYKSSMEKLKAGLASEMDAASEEEKIRMEKRVCEMFLRFYANPAIHQMRYRD